MTGRMDTFGLSDVGRVRECNEDQFLIADLKKSVVIHQTTLSYDDETHLMGGSQAKVFLVADGIGGRSAGDRASRLAIQGVVQYLLNTMHWLFRPNDVRQDDFFNDLRSALHFSQSRMQQAVVTPAPETRVGTTMTMAYIVWPQVYLVQVGNSGAYLFRDQQLTCLSGDPDSKHTGADVESTRTDPRKAHAQEIGSPPAGIDRRSWSPTGTHFRLALHDKLLLCTDGLTRHLGESAIRDHLSRDLSAEETCRRLIGNVNDEGGEDNTTVVLARFTDEFFESDRALAEEVPEEISEDDESEESLLTPRSAEQSR